MSEQFLLPYYERLLFLEREWVKLRDRVLSELEWHYLEDELTLPPHR